MKNNTDIMGHRIVKALLITKKASLLLFVLFTVALKMKHLSDKKAQSGFETRSLRRVQTTAILL